jgi:hypothetical protein
MPLKLGLRVGSPNRYAYSIPYEVRHPQSYLKEKLKKESLASNITLEASFEVLAPTTKSGCRFF